MDKVSSKCTALYHSHAIRMHSTITRSEHRLFTLQNSKPNLTQTLFGSLS